MSAHTYPSKYPPGTHWTTDRAWEIMDDIKPGVLSDDARFLTAGRIAGALMRAFEEGKHGKPFPQTPRTTRS